MLSRLALCAGLFGLTTTSSLGCRASSPPAAQVQATSAQAAASAALEGTHSLRANTEAQVHGRVRQVQGQTLLQLWGSPAEMGHAHGYLMRDEIIEIVDGYALDAVPPKEFERARVLFATAAHISDAQRAEASAMVQGMQAAGGAHVPGLGRELDAQDILLVNAITDLLSIGCSSYSSWGTNTEGDAQLQGAPAVVRNLDWDTDPDLLRNQIIIAYQPDTPGHEDFVSVGFAGYMGCLSCMNAKGVTALFNMGYGPGAASLAQAARGFSPANLSLRELVEGGDFDGDGDSDADDVEAGLRARTHAGSWILHLLEDGPNPARVLEVEAKGVVRRDPKPDSRLGGMSMAATNHMRSAHPARACSRYATIEKAARAHRGAENLEHMWELGISVALDEVVHTLLIQPRARSLKVRLRAPGKEMSASPRAVELSWAELFAAG